MSEENIIDIYKYLTITSSVKPENLKKFKYWNFEYLHKNYANNSVYKVCFNNNSKHINEFVNYDDKTLFCDVGSYVLQKECLRELCVINRLYGFTDRLLLCRCNSYNIPVLSLHFYCPQYGENEGDIIDRPGCDIDMNRSGDENFPDEFDGEFSIEKSNIMKITVCLICFYADDYGSYVPETNRYFYNFDTDMFMVKEDSKHKTLNF